MTGLEQKLSGWGRYPVQICTTLRPERYKELADNAVPLIVRGQGRSYGDAALNAHGHVLLTERINRLLAFDQDSGLLRAESGVTLAEIIDFGLPRGWFLDVTPGTKFVSLGGAIAADVHGKNHHHAGSFASSIEAFSLMTADGTWRQCSRTENAELYWATIGGMGLTGVIGEVSLRLRRVDSAYMRVWHKKTTDLESAFSALSEEAEYSVAWIDCLARGRQLGRSVAMYGEHAPVSILPQKLQADPLRPQMRKQRRLPFDLPGFALNSATIGLFNAYYYRREGARRTAFLSTLDAYFYPLDAIAQWNRLYGRAGFVQYQCVLPEATAYEGMRQLLEKLSASRRPSFLAVLKRLGPASEGLLSFPMAGYTLALDLPRRGKGLLELLDGLDEIVIEHGGRIYLAKDARLSRAAFERMYPQLDAWRAIKQQIDPQNRFTSTLAQRLGLEAEHG